MNWIALGLLAWVFLGLEKGVADALELGGTGIAPSFVFGLLTFVAMSAPPGRALWAAVGLGVAMDLLFSIALDDGAPPVYLAGPHALSYVLGTQLVLALRGLMIRRNPLAMGFLACMGFVVARVALVAMLSLREGMGTPISWDAKGQLLAALGSGVYTGVVAVGLALALIPLGGFLGLPGQQQRRFGRRA